jgi:hypothetical protein
MVKILPISQKGVKSKNMKSPWEPEFTEDGQYVWHYCKFCGVAMNRDHKPDCPAKDIL